MQVQFIIKRAIASILDKITITIISALTIMVIAFSTYVMGFGNGFATPLAAFHAFFNSSTANIEVAAEGNVLMKHGYNPYDTNSDVSAYSMMKEEYASEIESYKKLIILSDVFFTFLFLLINCCYYFVAERFLKSSLWKRVFGLVLVDENEQEVISNSKAYQRVGLFFFYYCVISFGLRWIIGLGYPIIIFIFFLLLDITVLLNKGSLLDILSKTVLVDVKSVKSRTLDTSCTS